MKLHKNASLTLKKRQQIKDLFATGKYTQLSLATQFGVTRKTISKWINRTSVEDSINKPKKAKTITPDFVESVKLYRENLITSHHGKVRIAHELEKKHNCSNPSNVYAVLKQLSLNQPRKIKEQKSRQIPVGKHRTQMDIQVLPAIEGNEGL